MEKFIEVHDDILNPRLVDIVENVVLVNANLPFNYNENLTFPRNHPSFSFKPGINHTFILYQQQKYPPFFFNNILYNFCVYKGIVIDKIIAGRVFIDFPTPSPKLDWPPHQDLDSPHWVCLYYVNDSEGDTVFFDDSKKEIKRVSPKKGRIAFFDGTIYHAGTPSETNSRAVINFDFVPYL